MTIASASSAHRAARCSHSPLQGRCWPRSPRVLLVLVPVRQSVRAGSSALHVPDYVVTLLGKFMCYAIVALAMDLIWGYTGILSLGHGRVLRARRLRDGHVPDALDRQRRRVPQRSARTSWCSSTGRSFRGTGRFDSTSGSRRCWSCWCPACSRSSSATSRSARASRASTSRSSRRR